MTLDRSKNILTKVRKHTIDQPLLRILLQSAITSQETTDTRLHFAYVNLFKQVDIRIIYNFSFVILSLKTLHAFRIPINNIAVNNT